MEEKTSEPVWIVYCDGAWGASGAGAGAVISSPSGAKLRYAARLDFRTTSNVAEYEAVLLGLRKARALGARRVILKTDSQVVAGHIDKRFQAREPKLIKYMAAVRSMEKHFLGFTVKSISRNDNFKADDLAKAVAQRIPTPPDVFLSRIKSASCRRTFPGGSFHYAVVAVEYFSKWVKATPLSLLLSRALRKQAAQAEGRAQAAEALKSTCAQKAEDAETKATECIQRMQKVASRSQEIVKENDSLREDKRKLEETVVALRDQIASSEGTVRELQGLFDAEKECAKLRKELEETQGVISLAAKEREEVLEPGAVSASEVMSRSFENIGSSAPAPSLKDAGLGGLIKWISKSSKSLFSCC
ncbi:hypothetical protein ACQ4PT_046658 [Festuca glaucescens]